MRDDVVRCTPEHAQQVGRPSRQEQTGVMIEGGRESFLPVHGAEGNPFVLFNPFILFMSRLEARLE